MGRISRESLELMVPNLGLLPLPFVELLLEDMRLASLEMVIDLDGTPGSLRPGVGVGRHSANASWGRRMLSTPFFSAAFFSFFSISFRATFLLRAPRADMVMN